MPSSPPFPTDLILQYKKGSTMQCTLLFFVGKECMYTRVCVYIFIFQTWRTRYLEWSHPHLFPPHKYRRGNKISKLIKHLRGKPSLSIGETRVGDNFFPLFIPKKIYTTTLFVLNQSVFDDDAFSSSTFFSSISCSSIWNLRKKL